MICVGFIGSTGYVTDKPESFYDEITCGFKTKLAAEFFADNKGVAVTAKDAEELSVCHARLHSELSPRYSHKDSKSNFISLVLMYKSKIAGSILICPFCGHLLKNAKKHIKLGHHKVCKNCHRHYYKFNLCRVCKEYAPLLDTIGIRCSNCYSLIQKPEVVKVKAIKS